MLSTHVVEVVPLTLSKHPNADTLSIAQVYGFTCVTGTDQWAGIDRAAFIPPDNLVPVDRPEFQFLAKDARTDGYTRIRAKKIRGALSFGLLVPAPVGSAIGDDVTEALGVLHYEPPVRGVGRQNGLPSGEATSGPDVYTVKYDIESGRRWAKDVMVDGEDVWVTEKLHGMNSRYVYHDGKMHCGSRTEWKKEYVDNSHLTVEALVESSKGKLSAERAAAILEAKKGKPAARTVVWEALTPTLRSFCESNPGLVVYGEVYGAVQDLSYGHTAGQVSFAAFDVLDAGNWWDSQKFFDTLASYNAPTVPVLYHGPYDFDRVCDLAEGNSTLASHIREGVVLVPAVERSHRRLGRVKLKFVSAAYLERAK